MSYQTKWIDEAELKYIATETDLSVLDLQDRDPDGEGLGGAYGMNLENRLLEWGISKAEIKEVMERAVGSWEKCKKAFENSGYTGGGVATYMDSRQNHDPMDDDLNRIR